MFMGKSGLCENIIIVLLFQMLPTTPTIYLYIYYDIFGNYERV